MTDSSYEFVLGRTKENDHVNCWRVDLDSPELLVEQKLATPLTIKADNVITPAGKYLLEWGKGKKTGTHSYKLHDFDPVAKKPFGKKPIQKGVWYSRKFFHGHLDFGHFGNVHNDSVSTQGMQFIPLGNYILAFVSEPGRGNYHLWNFDPGSDDPLQRGLNSDGAWGDIQYGHKLIPIGNMVIDWVPKSGEFRLLSFDPQNRNPLRLPALQQGKWPDINRHHELVPIGDYILDWKPKSRDYRLWKFDAKSKNLLSGKPVKTGKLPKTISANMTLTGMQPNRQVNAEQAAIPGTPDYMRSKIKHVVYYMVENRSFDHVCGWLYDNDDIPAQIIDPNGKSKVPFNGASTKDYNLDATGEKISVSVYKEGRLSKDIELELLPSDPHHDHSDVMRQMFHPDGKGYDQRKIPNMGGFVINNGLDEVMETYSPTQLPVLSGLAKNFALSDEWYCSMPGGTDVNRAYSVTGSSFNMLNNFQNGVEYAVWPEIPRRPSVWKTLISNGVTDWKIYNSVEWYHYVFTYHLFLQGQVPSVDQELEKDRSTGQPGKYVAGLEHFLEDAKNGTLPAFSYLEPVWVAPKGTTSYHPGHDLVPSEVALNEIFNALQAGPNWDETLLIITFDEHGGIYDHMPPPYAENPWPNDENNGFKHDIMGVRVPTILVSPMIKKNTVFRAGGKTAYDATSFLATLLNWFGIPKSRWGLGERTNAAPTFEGVINRETPRTDVLKFTPPYDTTDPAKAMQAEPHDLARTNAERAILQIGKEATGILKLAQTARDIANTKAMHELHDQVAAIAASSGLQNASHSPRRKNPKAVNCVEVMLGEKEELAAIYSYDSKSGIRLTDWIGHAINQSLERDLFHGAWADVFWEGNAYGVKITSPYEDVSGYTEKIEAFLKAGRMALATYGEHYDEITANGLKFLLPFGLSMVRTKSIQLLHFPPIETLNYRDYLYSPTNRRWESLLQINGHDSSKNSLLERITDAVPLAAAGGDSKGIAPFNDRFLDYGKQMLIAGLDFSGKATQPVVAYGSPVRKWIGKAFTGQVKTPLDVLSLVSVELHNDGVKTPILCANHPSKFFYFNDPKNPKGWAVEITIQDLIAARWQIEMAENRERDPADTLNDAIKFWKKRSDDILAIVEEQKREFGFGH